MSAEDNVEAILTEYGANEIDGPGDWDGLVKALADLVRRGPVPLVSKTAVSVAPGSVAPDDLCGINGCVFTPHDRFKKHSWDPSYIETDWKVLP